jgi:adenylate kinase family enzyme
MRVAILGNSGSGKSTLARKLAADANVPMLDLDTVAWQPKQIAVARPDAEALKDVEEFCSGSDWIVEGCYAHLVAASLPFEPELIFLNPGVEACKEHCRQRPWEPHKYASRADQDAKLPFLLEWVEDYYRRDGNMSLQAHRALFDSYKGPKREVT